MVSCVFGYLSDTIPSLLYFGGGGWHHSHACVCHIRILKLPQRSQTKKYDTAFTHYLHKLERRAPLRAQPAARRWDCAPRSGHRRRGLRRAAPRRGGLLQHPCPAIQCLSTLPLNMNFQGISLVCGILGLGCQRASSCTILPAFLRVRLLLSARQPQVLQIWAIAT